MRREDALAALGLGADADPRTVRRRFRMLAREHHPDRGGAPERFAELHRAYAALRDLPTPARPTVARGRPSRTAATAGRLDTDADAEAAALARRLATGPVPTGAGGVRRLRLVSVAPGARRNRAVAALPEGSVARLELTAGPARAGVRLVVRSRAARRVVVGLALDAPGLGGSWTRHRGDAAMELRCDLVRPDVPAEAAARAAVGLLGALGWPLREWAREPAP